MYNEGPHVHRGDQGARPAMSENGGHEVEAE
jgi:hypothetical protein